MTETTMSATAKATTADARTGISAKRPVPPKTAAEQGLLDVFARTAARLPGSGWVAKVRGEAVAWLDAHGLPTRRVEAFRYTDLRERIKQVWAPASGAAAEVSGAQVDAALGPLAALDGPRLVFVDGVFNAALSRTADFDGAVEQMPLAPLLRKAPAWLEGKFAAGRLGEDSAMTALNTAFMSDGLMIKIKPGQSFAKPVFIVFVRASAEPVTIATRNVVAMEAGSSMTMVEVYTAVAGAASQGIVSGLTDVTVADGASLVHITCAIGGSAVSHLSNVAAKVGADANYRVFQLTAGPQLARNDLLVEMSGTGSKLDISGAFLARGTAHVDTTLVVDHKVPHCESRELFKAVLADRARGVFQGKVIVRPGADKTDGKQMARALLLSEDAEFDSKPELEIYADDVACGHGATAAALDENLMFYCRSRGIPETEARALLIEAFIGEAIEKVEHEAVRAALMELARQWLSHGDGPTAGSAT